MSNEEIGRIGVACIIAALGALVEAHLQLCSDSLIRKAIFWWLIMIIGCGSILDATAGTTKIRLLLGAVVISSAFISTAFFISVVDQSGSFCFSGVTENHPAFFLLAIFIWFITGASVFLLSFSRPVIKNILVYASREKTAVQISNIEKTVRAVIGVIAVIALLFQIG